MHILFVFHSQLCKACLDIDAIEYDEETQPNKPVLHPSLHQVLHVHDGIHQIFIRAFLWRGRCMQLKLTVGHCSSLSYTEQLLHHN